MANKVRNSIDMMFREHSSEITALARGKNGGEWAGQVL